MSVEDQRLEAILHAGESWRRARAEMQDHERYGAGESDSWRAWNTQAEAARRELVDLIRGFAP